VRNSKRKKKWTKPSFLKINHHNYKKLKKKTIQIISQAKKSKLIIKKKTLNLLDDEII